MSKQFTITIILVLFTSISSRIYSQNFHLLDINSSKDGNPYTTVFNTGSPSFILFNGASYFVADDGVHGFELWRSDGTSTGTYLLKDIAPGSSNSNTGFLTVCNNKLFFSANSDNAFQLYVSDGTEAGTHALPGPIGYLNSLTDLNGILYFFDASARLWKSDGTPEHTEVVTTLNNSFAFNYQMVNLNGVLYFTAYNFIYGNELFRTDGTAAGTYLLKDINTSGSSNPSQLTVLNGRLYFVVDDGGGRRLWSTDGTSAGTTPVTNSNDVIISYNFFTTLNSTLYFAGSSSATGMELYKYDTDIPDITLVKDIVPGSYSSKPENLTIVNGKVFFSTRTSDGNTSIWKSDGTGAGTVLVKDLKFYHEYGLTNFYNANGELYFNYFDNINGAELWKSDGTNVGTHMVKDIYKGAISSYPANFTLINNEIVFSAKDEQFGIELWKTDGTGEGTKLLKDINQTTTANSSPTYLTNFNNKLFFSANQNRDEYQLWKSDGSEEGTSLYRGFLGGNSYTSFITAQKNNLYFLTLVDSLKLWKLNDINGLPVLMKTFGDNLRPDFILGVRAADDQVYFFLDYFNLQDYTQTRQLWRSDGTEQGTYVLKNDLTFGGDGVAVVGNNIFFTEVANTSAVLWKSDGTVAGTVPVKDFNSTSYAQLNNLHTFSGKVFFNSNDDAGNGLWRSDGTNEGTVFIKDIFRPGSFGYAVSNGKLFFDAGYNSELWETDGTSDGTKMVKQIGSYGSYPRNLTDVNGTVYFSADDGINGRELWKTDGTYEGTQLVKDITPGPTGSNFPFDNYNNTAMVNGNGKLYFTLHDQSYSNATLWQSDGTDSGTAVIQDNGLANISKLNELTSVGNKLFFSAYSYQYGFELYVGNANISKPPSITITNPVNNRKYLSPANITINAAASDADGKITKVEFYKGATLLYTANDTPYTFKWQHVLPGDYVLTAKATDNDGLVTTSDSIHISVAHNTPPTVNIITPVNNKIYLRPANIHLEAFAEDIDGRVTKVEFYNGTKLLQTSRLIPYQHLWTNVDTGHYTITARATDNWGAVTVSDPVNISVVFNQPPTVSIITPANEQNFAAPASINLEAAATDVDGRITKVEFYNGTTLLQTSRLVPYHHLWENIVAGTYNITAIATDNWGAKTTSAPVTINVLSPLDPGALGRPMFVNSKNEVNHITGLNLAPNPANNILNIAAFGLHTNSKSIISIISASGIVLKTIESNTLNKKISIDVSSLSAGMYYVKVINGDKVLYKQFIKL